jgi:hypothetical protein
VDAGFTRCKNNWSTMDTELFAARGGVATLDTRLDTIDTSVSNNTAEIIEATTKAWFYENVAPTNWTIDATVPDTLLAVKGGAAAYNVSGGTSPVASTWTQPDHVHEMGTHTHTLSAHTHTGPEHNHQWQSSGSGSDGLTIAGGAEDRTWAADGSTPAEIAAAANLYTKDAGTGVTAVPSSDITDAVDPGDAVADATAITWRPLAAVGIIATKDTFA